MNKEYIRKILPYSIPQEVYGTWEGFEVVTNKQSIKLLIETSQQCCENSGYFWCNDNSEDFIGAELLTVTLTDKELNKQQFIKNHVAHPSDEFYEGSIMFVNIETNKGTLQFVAYNEHNGYYGHEAKIISTQLKHEEIL